MHFFINVNRPTAVYVMHHPFFWSPELCLSFLRDTSDRIEKTSETDLIDALEGINVEAFGKNWGEKLNAALLADMGRYRKYSFESTRDLLRLIRNKSGHYREFSDDLKVCCCISCFVCFVLVFLHTAKLWVKQEVVL